MKKKETEIATNVSSGAEKVEVVEKEILPRSVVLALVAPGRYSGNCIQPPELLTVPSHPVPYSCAFHVHCGRSGTR